MINRNHNIEVFSIIVPVPSYGLRSVNFYLVKQEESFTLIDAGYHTDECWNALQQTLKQNGYELRDITEIVLTHHHIDHIGLVNRIVAEHPIPVYAHRNAIPRLTRDLDFLQMRVEFFKQLYEEMGCGEMGEKQVAYLHNAIIRNKDNKMQADMKTITDTRLLNLDVIEMFGHAPDQVAFFSREQKLLFGGDLLLHHISSNALVEPDFQGKRMKTLLQHKESYLKCVSLHADLVYAGHGIIIENPNDLLEKRIKGIDEKAQKFQHYIQAGHTTASAIAQAHYKQKYEQQFPLVMSEVIGHLDYLEEQKKVRKEFDKGVWQYFINADPV